MVDFSAVISNLVSIGFYEVFLPFILVYAVVFAILQKSKIFEGGSSSADNAKNVNAIVAFVFGLFVVASIQTVQYIESLIINAVLIMIFFLCILILFGFLFGEKYTEIFENKIVKWGAAIGIFLVLLGILLYILGFWNWVEEQTRGLASSETVSTIFVLAIVIGVLYFITKGDEKSK